MTEYGVFGDEGCVESGFYSRADALVAAARYNEGEEPGTYTVHAICEDHAEEPAVGCEKCDAEEED